MPLQKYSEAVISDVQYINASSSSLENTDILYKSL